MEKATISQLKNRLSAYLRKVRAAAPSSPGPGPRRWPRMPSRPRPICTYSKEMMEGTTWRCPAAGGAAAEFM